MIEHLFIKCGIVLNTQNIRSSAYFFYYISLRDHSKATASTVKMPNSFP